MRRREMLAGASVALFGGCLSSPSGVPSDPGTSSAPDTTAEMPSVKRTRFELQGAGCGTIRERADVSVNEETLTVTVDGTTSAQNACYSARLADATYDEDAGELRITIETYDASDEGVCAQCITELDYVATAEFTGGLPERVVVVHRTRGEKREVTSTSLSSTATSQ